MQPKLQSGWRGAPPRGFYWQSSGLPSLNDERLSSTNNRASQASGLLIEATGRSPASSAAPQTRIVYNLPLGPCFAFCAKPAEKGSQTYIVHKTAIT